jgi:carbonic anhydrase
MANHLYIPDLESWSRRAVLAGTLGSLIAARAFAADHGASPGVTPDAALKRLMDGNARYAAGKSQHPNEDMPLRRSLAGGQHPFATILACADSRVGPELIFDQGLGDLFVVRVAGNVVDDVVLGSIEYAAVHLGVPLVMVLGHEHCGAVTATADALAGKSSAEDQKTKIGSLAALIAPAVRAAPGSGSDKVEAAVLLNARHAATTLLSTSSAVRERVHAGHVRVVSARYSLDNGKVSDVLPASA